MSISVNSYMLSDIILKVGKLQVVHYFLSIYFGLQNRSLKYKLQLSDYISNTITQ